MDNRTVRRLYHAACASMDDAIDFPPVANFENVASALPAHADLLLSAIEAIPNSLFPKLKSGLLAGYKHLHWRIDDGGYYKNSADVGDGYKSGNMHALLIGPRNCPVIADDLLFGLFLLAPRTLYRDHKHLAPEVYLPLTGPHGWRFDLGEWQDYPAGQTIYNDPEITHATRVYDTPFLALFAWTEDTDKPCEVVPSDDWAVIDRALNP